MDDAEAPFPTDGDPDAPRPPAVPPTPPAPPSPAAPAAEGPPVEAVLPAAPSGMPSGTTAPADGGGVGPLEGPAPEEGGAAVRQARGKGGADAPPLPPPPPDRLDGAVAAVLMAAGESVSAERIRDLLGLPSALHVRESVERLRTAWRDAGLPVEIQDVAGGHRVTTRPEYAEYVRRLWRRPTSDRLSPPLMETLSIVAYRQPVARAEIERIRGVQCGDALRGLLDRRLIKVAGRSDQPGRPLLYATTVRFLEVFGLAGLEDLPQARDLQRL